MFVFNSDMKLEEFENGPNRKVLAYTDNMMAVEVFFDDGTVAALHSHPHEQLTYVISGEFEFTIGEETKIVKAGDTLYKEPNIIHGAKCLKKGVLLDTFTPMRKDFVEA